MSSILGSHNIAHSVVTANQNLSTTQTLVAVKIVLIFVLSISYQVCMAAGKVYSWRDENGELHFGDKAPSADAEAIELKPSSNGDIGTRRRLERTKKLVDSLAEEREERREARVKVEQARQQRQKDCQAAQSEFRKLTEAQFVYRKGEAGEKQILSFEERAEAERKAREKMRKSCGGN